MEIRTRVFIGHFGSSLSCVPLRVPSLSIPSVLGTTTLIDSCAHAHDLFGGSRFERALLKEVMLLTICN